MLSVMAPVCLCLGFSKLPFNGLFNDPQKKRDEKVKPNNCGENKVVLNKVGPRVTRLGEI
jgi:hypothetical protein